MGDPNRTTPETLTTKVLVPPDLSHLKMYLSVTNGLRRQQIKEDLANCKQHGMHVQVYYRKLTKIMDTYYRPLHVCKCGRCECDLSSLQKKEREDDMVHQFLYGLDGHKFKTVRSELSSRIPLPSLEEAYNIILRQEEEDLKNKSRPEDELLEFLERLPVKSLCRFKSVSKQWKSMIESSYLAKKRLVRYPSPKLLVLRSEISSVRSSRTIFLETISKEDQQDHNKIIIYTYKFPHPYPANNFDDNLGRIMGYCNGLVCIYDSGYIYLINPATRKLRVLSPEFLLEYTGRSGWPGELPFSVGFGRDIVTGAYKVILMYLLDRNTVKTEVFNLNNGERRYICIPLLYDQFSNDKSPIYANGSLFWLSWLSKSRYESRKDLTKLGAIDLHTEQFHDVLLPTQYTKYSESVYIWSLRDRLCISDVLQYPNVDVWGLQQEDPSVKWEKIHSIDIFSIDLDANYWKLALTACHHGRTRYDQLPKHLLVHVMDERRTRTVLCTENLVSSV